MQEEDLAKASVEVSAMTKMVVHRGTITIPMSAKIIRNLSQIRARQKESVGEEVAMKMSLLIKIECSNKKPHEKRTQSVLSS